MDRNALIAAMQATPLDVRAVHVPGWGDLHVRELSADTVDRLRKAKKVDGADGINALAMSAAATICNEHGALLFDLSNSEDIALLGTQGFDRLSIVLAAANKMLAADDGDESGGDSGKA